MAKKNLDDYKFVRCEDGIYLAKPLKKGGISADARKVSDGEIVGLFKEFFPSWCMVNRTPRMTLERNGKPFIEVTLKIGED